MWRLLFYYRGRDGDWYPQFGAFSSPLGGTLILAGIAMVTGSVIVSAYRRMKSGRPGQGPVAFWALGTWVVTLIDSVPHASPKWTPVWVLMWLPGVLATLAWGAYGLVWVVPALLDRRARPQRPS